MTEKRAETATPHLREAPEQQQQDPLNSAFPDGGVLHRTHAVYCPACHLPRTCLLDVISSMVKRRSTRFFALRTTQSRLLGRWLTGGCHVAGATCVPRSSLAPSCTRYRRRRRLELNHEQPCELSLCQSQNSIRWNKA
jgi:hypothetical protein